MIQSRLDVVKTIDESAALSFMDSANFRLELLSILNRFDARQTTSNETLAAMERLHRRVDDVVLAGTDNEVG
ncbi:hypothetical protein [Frondihabitans cladoniiphilus]|uniref:hypothetical protein n=1 Tax=Frondihabitans cladoniiphilus TaxID=715785 RepID=UPI0031EB33F6